MARVDEILRPRELMPICSAQAVAQNGTWTSTKAYDISFLKKNRLALAFTMTDAGAGTGRGTLEVLLSINGTDYVNTLADVKAAITAANGAYCEKVAMDTIPALSFKVKVTETSNTEAIAITIDAVGE